MPQLRLKHHVPREIDLEFRPKQAGLSGRCLEKGKVDRRIIATAKSNEREIQLHATKGFRSRRA